LAFTALEAGLSLLPFFLFLVPGMIVFNCSYPDISN